ncbi:hypothetical protein G3M48_007922 [Beauveria asiatica]|uniref:BRCT domain-containing protein n=1 Tax=Beauveria asiatica TaxID=1069075 RepID=A0AAW0RLN6_9HYPO
MANLQTFDGQHIEVAGSFLCGSQEDVRRKLRKIGVKSATKTIPWTVLVATDAAFAQGNKLVVTSKEKELPILNEEWLNACLEADAYVPPETNHYHFGQPTSLRTSSTSMPSPPASKEPTPEVDANANDEAKKAAEAEAKAAEAEAKKAAEAEAKKAAEAEAKKAAEAEAKKAAEAEAKKAAEAEAKKAAEAEAKKAAEARKRAEENPNGVNVGDQRFDQTVLGQNSKHIRDAHLGEFSDARKILLLTHPNDAELERSAQRKNYEMTIECQTSTGYLLVTDPQTSHSKLPCARAGYLVRRSDYATAAAAFQDAANTIAPSSPKTSLDGKALTDFIWWTVAYNGRLCYAYGVLDGESTPRLFARTVLKDAFGKVVDRQIDEIRESFEQPDLASLKAKRKTQSALLKLN